MTSIIGIKELQKKIADVAKAVKAGDSFIVVKHSKPIFRIEPIEGEPRYTSQDLKKIQFSGSDPKLSQRIDEIVYGV